MAAKSMRPETAGPSSETTPVEVSSGEQQSPIEIAQGTPRTTGPVAVPEGGTDVNEVGIVAHDGDTPVRVHSSPQTSESNVVGALPFNARVQVVKRMPGDWLFVSSGGGVIGFVAAQYVWSSPEHPLPEPNARLHRVEGGASAIGIAEQYYRSQADDWGQDLRFYVNVLAHVNRISVPPGASGWRSVQFREGQFIWIPSVAYAQGLRGTVSSGSLSYEAADAVGIAGGIERTGELMDDFGTAISRSMRLIPGAVARHVEQSLQSILESLLVMAVGAVGVLAVSTAIGAALGALAGGVGAAPGAAAGFEVGLALLEWLGLGFLLVWAADALGRLGGAFGAFLGAVWSARGDAGRIEAASRAFAEAVGTLCGVLLEAAVLYAAAVGVPAAMARLGRTPLGMRMGETALGEWLGRRASNVQTGQGPVATPRQAWESWRARRAQQDGPARVNSTVDENIESLIFAEEIPARYAEIMGRIRAGRGAVEVGRGEISMMDLAVLTRFHPNHAEFALVQLRSGKYLLVEMGSYRGGELPPDTARLLGHSHPPDGGSGAARWVSEADVQALVQLGQSESFLVTQDGTVYRFTQGTPPNSIGEAVQSLHPVHGLVGADRQPLATPVDPFAAR